jgi:hypothetical protein
MKHAYKLLLLFFLSPLFSFSQTNYKPGYVVKLGGDTLHGFIDYKEWGNNPKAINFKYSTDKGAAMSFSTTDAQAFGVTGLEHYRRFVLPISQDEVEVSKLPKALDTTSTIGTVFLKVVTDGKNLTMFNYTDGIKSRFYILEKSGSQPQELIYHAYYSSEESAYVKYVTTYRGQLEDMAQRYAVKTSQLDQKVLEAKYTESDLKKIVRMINGPSSQQSPDQSLGGSRWFVGLGVNASSLKYKNIPGTPSQPTTTISSSSIFPQLSAGIDFFPNKSVQQLIIRLEFSFTTNSYNLSGANPQSTPSSQTILNFKQYDPSFAPQIIFNAYNTPQLKVFAGVGAAFNFSAYNSYQSITRYGGSIPDNVQDNSPAFSKFWISIPIKAGITINNNIEISVCYMPSSSLTSDNIASANVTSFQAGVSYLFGSK